VQRLGWRSQGNRISRPRRPRRSAPRARCNGPSLRRQSKLEHGLTTSRTLHSGVLVVVQRFRSDLGLYVHLHALAMDGQAPSAKDRVSAFFMVAMGLLLRPSPRGA
jgi:hypothetical protein